MAEKFELTENLVKNIPFFVSFPDEYIPLLIPHLEIKTYAVGEKIIEQGNLNLCLHFLLEGKVDIFVGDDFIVDISRSGEVFGEVSIACHQTSSASVVASRVSTFLEMPYTSVRQINNDALWMHIYKNLSEMIAIKLIKTNELAKTYKNFIDSM